jgi:hypothetical protein
MVDEDIFLGSTIQLDLPQAPRLQGRPNSVPLFETYLQTTFLADSPSPLRPLAWSTLLRGYPGNLPAILQGILTYGTEIGPSSPMLSSVCKNHLSSRDNEDLISEKIVTDLALGRIQTTDSAVTSPLGLVPKADGGFRRIHDLSSPEGSSVNDSIDPAWATLHYTRVETILAHVITAGRGCYLVKRDIKDAFRIVPVSVQSRHLLGFIWKGVTYVECCLPFGLRTAPFLFNLFAEGLHWILAQQIDSAIEHYLDDFIFVVKCPTMLPLLREVYLSVTDQLGVPRNDTKNIEGTEAEVLGYTINTVAMELRLSPVKQQKAIDQVTEALQKGWLSLQQAQQLAGRLAWCARVIRLGRSYSRSLWDFIIKWPTRLSRYTPRRLPLELKEDLNLWLEVLISSNGILFFDDKERPQFHLFTDASSLKGYGGFYFSGENGYWPDHVSSLPQAQAFSCHPLPDQADDHINPKEIHAIAEAFRRWSPVWRHGSLCIHTDNMVAYSGIQNDVVKGPGNRSLREILISSMTNDITMTTIWVSSANNGLADALSRFDREKLLLLCPKWQMNDGFLPNE